MTEESEYTLPHLFRDADGGGGKIFREGRVISQKDSPGLDQSDRAVEQRQKYLLTFAARVEYFVREVNNTLANMGGFLHETHVQRMKEETWEYDPSTMEINAKPGTLNFILKRAGRTYAVNIAIVNEQFSQTLIDISLEDVDDPSRRRHQIAGFEGAFTFLRDGIISLTMDARKKGLGAFASSHKSITDELSV